MIIPKYMKVAMTGGINLSGREADERKIWTEQQLNEGWVHWENCPPEEGDVVECRNDGEMDIWEVTPKKMSMGWNVKGIIWRKKK